jgi:hypothetical protein
MDRKPMKRRSGVKLALLATAALTAGYSGAAHAAAPAPAPSAAIGAPLVADAVSDEVVVQKPGAPLPAVGIAAALTAALAALVKLIGWARLSRASAAVARTAVATARSAADASIAAAKAVGRAAASPIRFALLVIGFVLFAMIGIDVLDIEWAAGLATGAALVGLLWFGRLRRRRFAKAAAAHKHAGGA